MIFKLSNGNGDGSFGVWTKPGSSDGGANCSSIPSSKCSLTFESSRVDEWNDIHQVMYYKSQKHCWLLYDMLELLIKSIPECILSQILCNSWHTVTRNETAIGDCELAKILNDSLPVIFIEIYILFFSQFLSFSVTFCCFLNKMIITWILRAMFKRHLFISDVKLKLCLTFWHFQSSCHFERQRYFVKTSLIGWAQT